jgi:hypothetical protein
MGRWAMGMGMGCIERINTVQARGRIGATVIDEGRS